VSRRSAAEKVEGFVFDGLLFTVAVMVSYDEIQAWLFEHPRELYYGMSALHVIAIPLVIVAVVSGFGQSEHALRDHKGPNIVGWGTALLLGCSFIVPVVLAMSLDQQLGVALSTVFGPFVVLAVMMTALVNAEKRGWIEPARQGEQKAWWKVQVLALVGWAYLLWMETLMLVAPEKGGPLAEVGLPLGVLVDYVPVRVMLYYIRDASRWEIATIAASTLHLVYRLAAA
jgi:hypothetical protein